MSHLYYKDYCVFSEGKIYCAECYDVNSDAV